MNWIEALILGIIQGLTEFLPVSSSGHLELGKVILGVNAEKSLIFTVVVHGATVLSTIVVFWKDILQLLRGFFSLQWNDEKKYITKILFSMLPVLVVGLFFAEEVEAFFSGDLVFVGSMLIITAILLMLTYIPRKNRRPIGLFDALVIGIAQAAAVLPGISRSGSTIATGLIIGNKRENIARFSFLMVLIPILGANFKDLIDQDLSSSSDVTALPLVVGFIAAFIAGLMACKWMIDIVKKGKLIYFAIYCFIIGSTAIIFGIL